MKPFLHWLRWDLRRFRWLLLAWTALAAGFFSYVGWLHLHLLTIEPSLLKSTEPVSAVLGAVGCFLILHILSTDPAAGAQPFWKTRPPAGPAIAGVKVVIVIFFFLALPMLLQWLMYQWCGLGAPGPHWGGKSWPRMLWWTQGLGVGALLFASAASRGAGGTLGRLAGGGLLLLGAVPIAFQMTRPSLAGYFSGVATAGPVETGILDARSILLWLVTGIGCSLWLRRTRTPSRFLSAVPVFLPLVVFVAVIVSAEPEIRYARPDYPLFPPEQASALRIGEPFLRAVGSAVFLQADDPAGRRMRIPSIGVDLHLSGLPPDSLASAKWKRLRLIHPDGRVLDAPLEMQTTGYAAPSPQPDRLPVMDVRFRPGSLDAFSLTACRAEGVVSVAVFRWQGQAVPVEPGQRIEQPSGTLVIQERMEITAVRGGHGTDGPSYWGRELMRISGILRNDPLSSTRWRLQQRALPECGLDLLSNRQVGSGYFMEFVRADWMLSADSRNSPLAEAKLRRAAGDDRLEEWELRASWLEPLGCVDVPVTLTGFFIPRQPDDVRKAHEILAAIHPRQLSPGDLKRAVKLALAMPALSGESSGPDDSVVHAMRDLLAEVSREQLPALLEVARDDLPDGNMMSRQASDDPLCRRIAELMDAEEVARLRDAEPRMVQYLGIALADRKLISSGEAQGVREPASAEELWRQWQVQKYAPVYTGGSALAAALEKGCAWAIPELAELTELTPAMAVGALTAFAGVCECPAEPAARRQWLRENAARLQWDAAAKRWVLPDQPR